MIRQHVLSLGARCPAPCTSLLRQSAGMPAFFNPSRGYRRNRRSLEIILLQDHDLGMQGEVVKVRPGFGRNWLIPQKFAVYATAENRAIYEVAGLNSAGDDLEEGGDGAAHDFEFRRFLKEYVANLEAVELNFTRYTENDVLTFPVTKRDIVQKLWNHHELIGLTEESVVLSSEDATVETLGLGDHAVKIKLGSGWVAPGVGIFEKFARLAANEEVEIRCQVLPKVILSAEEKEDKRQEKKSKRNMRKEDEEKDKEKRRGKGKK